MSTPTLPTAEELGFTPFDDSVILRAVTPRRQTAQGIHVTTQEDDAKRPTHYGQILAIGPGQIVTGQLRRREAWPDRSEIAPPKADPIRQTVALAAEMEVVRVIPAQLAAGMYVLFTQGVHFQPRHGGPKFVLTRVSFVAMAFRDFEEEPEAGTAPPAAKVPHAGLVVPDGPEAVQQVLKLNGENVPGHKVRRRGS